MLRSRTAPVVTALLVLALAGQGLAQDAGAPDFSDAKNELKRALRADRHEPRAAAVRKLVAANDARGVKELRTALNILEKAEAKLDRKIDPVLDDLAEITEKIDKRFGGRQQIAAGSVQHLLDEQEELRIRLRPMMDERRSLQRSIAAVLVGIGDLVTALPEADRAEQTTELIELVEKLREPEEKLQALRILSWIPTPQSILGLVGLALNEEDPATRIGALEALERLGDPRGGEAALALLGDEYWQVRATAISALARLGHALAVPSLVEVLEREEGRLRGDAIAGLRVLSGRDFKDNATLWKGWWKEKGEALTEAVAGLESDDDSVRRRAVETIRDERFLLGVRRLLHRLGLSPAALDRREARGGAPAVGAVEGEERAAGLQAAGEALGGLPAAVREDAVEDLLVRPWRRAEQSGPKAELLRLMGRAGGEKAAEIVVARLGGVPESEDDRTLHIAAIEATGHLGRKEDVPRLTALFRETEPRPEALLAAVEALARIATREAVVGLVGALGQLEAYAGSADVSGVAKSASDRLRELTGSNPGAAFAAWSAWLREEGRDFETARDKEVAKSEDAGDKEGPDYGFFGIKTYSKRLVYVLDVSGSMTEPAEYGGMGKTKIEVAKEELLRSISSLPEDAEFNIVFYSTEFSLWKKKLQTADARTKKAAREWIEKVEANGGTNIFDPLAKAFELAGRGTFDKAYKSALDTIFFLSDGQPTAGRFLDPNDILAEIRKLNSLKKVEIHTVGVGRGHVAGFMKALADMSGGQYVAR